MSRGLMYPIGNTIIRACTRLFARHEVEGIENVPRSGPLLVISNHLSNVDPSLLGISLPRDLHFLAKQELFRLPVIRNILRSYGAFPIHRDGRDIRAMKWALGLLENGNALAVFPEGTRKPQGLGKFNLGAALLHLRSGAPILPVAITGTSHLISSARIFSPTGAIKVRIGDPFALNTKGVDTKRESLEDLTQQIVEKIAVLLPPSYHGIYAKDTTSR